MADDMAASDVRWMPRTRRIIGERGATFESALSTNPMCCPARAVLLSGSESHNNGVWSNSGSNGGYGPLGGGTRLPEWLQAAGYRTAFMGKHLNGFREQEASQEPGWNVLDGLIKGVYSYRSFVTWNDGRPRRVSDYVANYLQDSADEALERFERQDSDPFFMWVSHVGPHNARANRCSGKCWGPPVPAGRDRGTFAGIASPTRSLPSFNRRNDDSRPPFLRRLSRVSRREVDRLHQRRVETLQSIDRSVAHLARSLEAAGELDETVLIFTSDNGYMLGQYRYIGKRLGYDDSLRIPLLIRGPGVRGGMSVTGAATTADLSRTIVDLAGATSDRPVDGVSLVPSLSTGRTSRESALVQTGASYAGEGDGYLSAEPSDRGWLYRGYRDDRWTYVRYPDPSGDDTPAFEELFDRLEDPYQLTNLASDPAHLAVLEEARRRSAELERCAGISCVQTWGPIVAPPGVD